MEAPATTANDPGLWDRFTAKATVLGATVQRVANEAAAAELVAQAGVPVTCTRSLAERFPRVTAGGGTAAGPQAVAAEVVASGRFAIAETGSVLIAEDNRDRGACFLADRLWLLVAASDVVSTLDEAFARLGGLIETGERYLVFMSGPSRSADIERTVTIGVHGPRALTIVVVGEEAT